MRAAHLFDSSPFPTLFSSQQTAASHVIEITNIQSLTVRRKRESMNMLLSPFAVPYHTLLLISIVHARALQIPNQMINHRYLSSSEPHQRPGQGGARGNTSPWQTRFNL
jgi:hypothetical protein